MQENHDTEQTAREEETPVKTETPTFDPFQKETPSTEGTQGPATGENSEGNVPPAGDPAQGGYQQSPYGTPNQNGRGAPPNNPYGGYGGWAPPPQQGNGWYGAPPPQQGNWYGAPPPQGGYDYYGNRYWGGMQPPRQKNGMSIASMILGIACLTSLFGSYVSLILGVLAIVFAYLSRDKVTRKMNGMAKAGFICGLIGVIIMALAIITVLLAQLYMFGDGGVINEEITEDIISFIQRIIK